MTTAKAIAVETQTLHFYKPPSLNCLQVATYSTAAIKLELEEFVTAQSDGLHLAAEGYMTDL